VSIVKRRRIEVTLEDIVRAGAMSRPMAVFLEHCIVARANVLVCASAPALASNFLAALASVIAPGERVALLHEEVEVPLPQTYSVTLALPDSQEAGEATVRAAARLNVDHILAGPLGGRAAAALVEAVVDGHDGVLATMTAPTMRQAFARLSALLTMARPGMSLEAARDCVGESFDLGVELIRGADGRPKVARITELAGSDGKAVATKDLFLLGDAAGGDAVFQATGVSPRFVAEFAARGVRLDPNLFRRGASR
jgi:pilus assembly protein CpaF